jgi:hypothetical protein
LLSTIRAEFPPVTSPQTFTAPLEALMTRLRGSIYDGH